ncbi:hypothetical protein [Streptomonospora sp. PA3]|uniref:hypothetical protein n=1 Tax=Streptomonospora sp. PA3 TaxID=2607326 RepID=UPI00164361EE|nr:hypothetical protein [Streptomonospora sp. PA3]
MHPQHGAGESESGGGRLAETAGQARSAAGEVASTAGQEARTLAGDARVQAVHVADDVQERIRSEAQSQTRRAGENLRNWSWELESMAEHGETGSPVQGMVRQVARGGHEAADFLDERGVDGLIAETRDFARRRPMAFLVGAAVAGFAVGRVLKASSAGSRQDETATAQPQPAGDRPVAPVAPRQGEPSAGEAVPSPPPAPHGDPLAEPPPGAAERPGPGPVPRTEEERR